MDDSYKKLIENGSASVNAGIVGDWQIFYGGYADFWVWGDLGGGTAYLEAAIDTQAPCIVCGTEITEVNSQKSAVAHFNFNSGTKVRAIKL